MPNSNVLYLQFCPKLNYFFNKNISIHVEGTHDNKGLRSVKVQLRFSDQFFPLPPISFDPRVSLEVVHCLK